MCIRDRKKALPHEELFIDIGARNKEEALELVKPGESACFATKFGRLGENIVKGKALDDRVGCEMCIRDSMGTVDVNISDSFTQAGINQVKHTIYMEIKTEVRIVIPFMEDIEEVNMRLPLADSVIRCV